MMTAEEFILIPKHLYVKEQPHAARVLHDNNNKHKNAQLSYLNRLRPQLPPQTSKTTATKETFTDNVEPQQEQLKLLTDNEEVPVERVKDEILEEKHNRQFKSILGQLQVLEDKKFVRAKTVLEIIKNSERVTKNRDNEVIYVDKVPTGLKATIFLYDIQQPTKKLHNPAFINILTALNLNEYLVINRNGNTRFSQRLLTLKRNENSDSQEPAQRRPLGRKKVLQTLREVKNTNEKVSAVIEKPKTKNVKKSQKKALTHTERPITIQILQRQKRRRRKQNNGKITKIEEKLLKTKYSDKGPALFGSVNNLIKASNLSRKKVKHFLHTEPAYTKYRTVIRKTPRLKVIVYDIDEIWSLDLAFVDKLAQYNHDVKYLLVAVDCMSRYLRVQPLKSKYATTTAEAFKLMITTKQPEKV